jgi:hypothetical protein
MGLTLSEQKQLLKKSGVRTKKKSPFEIHEMLVASLGTRNRLSRKVDAVLHRKLGRRNSALLKLSPEVLMDHFMDALAVGDYLEVMWAVAVSPSVSLEFKQLVFGEIHMTMHGNAEQDRQRQRKLNQQRKQIEQLQASLKAAARERRANKRAMDRHKQDRAELRGILSKVESVNTKLQEHLAGLSNGSRLKDLEHETSLLKAERDALRTCLDKNQVRRQALEEENLRLSSVLDRQREANRQFEREAREMIREFSALSTCDTTCPAYDLCQKRILLVGGITRMESLYRELIEGRGGVFEYHDGYMKKGVKTLETRLRRADVVVCPVNCNSHAACSAVKNLAKKHNKTVHMIANSSLNALSQVIWGDSEANPTIN